MTVLYRLKVWLRLFRAHTVILEAPMAVMGASIALGTMFDPRVALWLLFGVLYHLVGYGMNSYADWKNGFDQDDERKQHHPLNNGDIKPEKAKKVIYVTTGILAVYSIALGGFTVSAVGFTVAMFASGVVYNYLGKYLTLKCIPIAVAHTLVFLYPYYVYTNSITVYAGLITLAYFVHHIYQIAISGDIKDIDQDEASLLQKLGARMEEHEVTGAEVFVASSKVLFYSYMLTLAELLLVIGSMQLLQQYIGIISVACIFGGVVLYETDKMLQSGAFLRTKRLKHISRREFAGYSMIHSAGIAVIGIEAFVLLISSMVIYLATVSKFIWGNWMVPDV